MQTSSKLPYLIKCKTEPCDRIENKTIEQATQVCLACKQPLSLKTYHIPQEIFEVDLFIFQDHCRPDVYMKPNNVIIYWFVRGTITNTSFRPSTDSKTL